MKALSIIVTDMGFIVPSMFLAKQLRKPRLEHLTDVMVFVLDASPLFISELHDEFAPNGIRVKGLSMQNLGISDDYLKYFKGHVPLAALARLAIAKNIPIDYDNILYLDGDMQIVGNIEPLLRFSPPEGKIAAVVENFVMLEGRNGVRPEWLEEYLTSLGINRAASYFNSGLMMFRRSTWEDIGPKALEFFLTQAEKCRHHDQSALNAVCSGNWLPLSPVYNYNSFFLRMGGMDGLEPRIVHFASSPKPWHSVESLWHPRYAQVYREFQRNHPVLANKISIYDIGFTPSSSRLVLKGLKARADAITRRNSLWRNFRRYMRETQFVVA